MEIASQKSCRVGSFPNTRHEDSPQTHGKDDINWYNGMEDAHCNDGEKWEEARPIGSDVRDGGRPVAKEQKHDGGDKETKEDGVADGDLSDNRYGQEMDRLDDARVADREEEEEEEEYDEEPEDGSEDYDDYVYEEDIESGVFVVEYIGDDYDGDWDKMLTITIVATKVMVLMTTTVILAKSKLKKTEMFIMMTVMLLMTGTIIMVNMTATTMLATMMAMMIVMIIMIISTMLNVMNKIRKRKARLMRRNRGMRMNTRKIKKKLRSNTPSKMCLAKKMKITNCTWKRMLKKMRKVTESAKRKSMTKKLRILSRKMKKAKKMNVARKMGITE